MNKKTEQINVKLTKEDVQLMETVRGMRNRRGIFTRDRSDLLLSLVKEEYARHGCGEDERTD